MYSYIYINDETIEKEFSRNDCKGIEDAHITNQYKKIFTFKKNWINRINGCE